MKIAVVGLGIAGLSVCAELARRGHCVEGFEQFALMHDRGSSHGDTRIFRLTPGEGDLYVRMAARSAEGWRDWEEIGGVRLIDWTGGLMAGPPGSAFVRSCIELATRYGHAHELLSAAEAGAASGGRMRFLDDWTICRQADCGVVLADAAREFLIRRARDLGAKLHENVPIEAVRGDAVLIGGETRVFDFIIVAAGSWAPKLLPEFAPHLSVRRKVMAWLQDEMPNPPRAPVICVDSEVGLFGMPAPGGLYKIGLHSVGEIVDPDDVRAADAADAAAVRETAGALLPGFGAPQRWARCLYTVTADEHFLIAPSAERERTLLFSACSGHGFKYAPMFGEIAADFVEGRAREEFEAFGLKSRKAAITPLGERV